MSGKQKYHIGKNGPAPCKATKRACRYGDVSTHFDNLADANTAYEKAMNTAMGGSFGSGIHKKVPTENTIPDTVGEEDSESNVIVDDEDEGAEDGAPKEQDVNALGFEKFKKKIERNNRRLARAGIEGRFELDAEPYKHRYEKDGEVYEEDRVKFYLKRPVISDGEYTFEARIEKMSEDNFVAYSAPGQELNGWRPDSTMCEHCNKNISRSKVYAVVDSEGNRKVVGGQCIELYTGFKPSNLWAMEYDPEKDLEEEDRVIGGGSGSPAPLDKTDDLLKVAYIVSKDEGYKPAAFGSDSTSSKVMGILRPAPWESAEMRAQKQEELASIESEAENISVDDIKAEIREAIKDADNDWAHNLRVFLDEEYVSHRGRGTVISAMAALHKHREKKSRKPWASGWIGDKGEKVQDVRAKVVRLEEVEEHYGYYPTYATKMTLQTEDGHNVFWKTSSANVPEKDDEIVFSATVKDTSTFKGVDITRILRAKWKKTDDEDNAD